MMPISYTKVNSGNPWDAETPIDTTNLDHVESGVKAAADGVDDLVDGTTPAGDADKLDGKDSGNASDNIPVSNGTVCTNLNADMIDGCHATDLFSVSVMGTVNIEASSSVNITHNFGTTNLIITLDRDGTVHYFDPNYSSKILYGYNFVDNNTVKLHNGGDYVSNFRYTITKIGG